MPSVRSEELMDRQSAKLWILIISICLTTGISQARADASDMVSILMTMCVTGGSEQKLEAQGQIDIALTLKKLRTGDIGGSGGVAGKFSKSEWQGLVGE
jgi:hypothetical protein